MINTAIAWFSMRFRSRTSEGNNFRCITFWIIWLMWLVCNAWFIGFGPNPHITRGASDYTERFYNGYFLGHSVTNWQLVGQASRASWYLAFICETIRPYSWVLWACWMVFCTVYTPVAFREETWDRIAERVGHAWERASVFEDLPDTAKDLAAKATGAARATGRSFSNRLRDFGGFLAKDLTIEGGIALAQRLYRAMRRTS